MLPLYIYIYIYTCVCGERLVHIPQSSKTVYSPSDGLVSKGTRCERSYPPAVIQTAYSTVPCTHKHTQIYVHARACAHTHTHTHIYIYIYIYIYTHTPIYTYGHTRAYHTRIVSLNLPVQLCVYIYIYICVYVCVYVCNITDSPSRVIF